MSDDDNPLSAQHATAWAAYHNARARLDETRDEERTAYWEGELRYWEERLASGRAVALMLAPGSKPK